uniref:AB hydrolase-1 domain-containing protein n=1 Tax=Chromera velia CCMP2878 TaxID=1169474 RepID=A0A0G4I143_9ALVE|eukprot:Cvel_25.t1-p1 / transcript=Cvel_25.t1 / gene=Cvel_25 / organism=Chromera_velia_CCMP2878 / gene_product=2-hydroxy-6-oxo-6-phenylhexa-2,4-dienoate hydrolase, putative / transcript_product=2-hydroxy-6-oxo-6-phenylhexa-2,4-dienoate hydrolase, putative / location=Cvel_scaffold5:155407-158599(+) / protein_length=362 / sequence_SO=supercontig / SO=protein_coding / is_pseudo=false
MFRSFSRTCLVLCGLLAACLLSVGSAQNWPDRDDVYASFIQAGDIELRYKILGDCSTRMPLVITPRGDRGLDNDAILEDFEDFMPLQSRFCVILWDRRNIGGSEVVYKEGDGEIPEWEHQAHDLKNLLDALGITEPVICIGESSGSRTSLNFAIHYPERVAALVLMNMTGGFKSVDFLARYYYEKYLEDLREGGMEKLKDDSRYEELMKLNPRNEARFDSMDINVVRSVLQGWARHMRNSATTPTVGSSEEVIQTVEAKTLLIFDWGLDDEMHTVNVMSRLNRLMPNSKLVVDDNDDADTFLEELDEEEIEKEIANFILEVAVETGYVSQQEVAVAVTMMDDDWDSDSDSSSDEELEVLASG